MSNQSMQGLWAAVILLGALIAAIVGAVAMWAAGAPAYASVGAGGATLLGTATLGFTTREFVRNPR